MIIYSLSCHFAESRYSYTFTVTAFLGHSVVWRNAKGVPSKWDALMPRGLGPATFRLTGESLRPIHAGKRLEE